MSKTKLETLSRCSCQKQQKMCCHRFDIIFSQNGSRIVVDILPGQAHFFQASLSASKSLQLQFEIEDAKEGTTYLSSSVQNPNSAIHDIACKIKVSNCKECCCFSQ